MKKLNKGMFLREMMERTIKIYEADNIACINTLGVATSSNVVHYIGNFDGDYVEIDAIQTMSINQLNLSFMDEARIIHKKKVKETNGLAFILVHFYRTDKYYIIDVEHALSLCEKDKPQPMTVQYLEHHGFELNVVYPCVLNLNELIQDMKGRGK